MIGFKSTRVASTQRAAYSLLTGIVSGTRYSHSSGRSRVDASASRYIPAG